MRRTLLFSVFYLIFCNFAYALDTFEHAKHEAEKIYVGPLAVDIYCGCKYDSNKAVDFASCGYKPHFLKRARRIEWEHVVPAYFFYKLLPCYRKGGRKACRKVSEPFRQMEGDLHNLRPAVGELNAIRSNKPYGLVRPKIKKYGRCDFYSNKNFAEPPDNVKGDVARITLYMNEKYRLQLPLNLIMLMRNWNKFDPVSNEERMINRAIATIQGDLNPYVR
jgi:deoxyribonuclease-1